MFAINHARAGPVLQGNATRGTQEERTPNDARAGAKILSNGYRRPRPLPATPRRPRPSQFRASQQRTRCGIAPRPTTRCALLREYFPAFLQAVATSATASCARRARTILAAAPNQADAARPHQRQVAAMLKKAGRKGAASRPTLSNRYAMGSAPSGMRRCPWSSRPGLKPLGLLLRTGPHHDTNADELEQATTEAFAQHPDAPIITSFPVWALIAGATCTGTRLATEPPPVRRTKET